MNRIGIRREDKNDFERRVPLVPSDLEALVAEQGLLFTLQPSPRRIFREDEYLAAEISEDLSACDVVMGVKEIPVERFRQGATYVFFSHTIKGQAHNMVMLKRLMELGCTLLDYELITDDAGRRLVFFGEHAGLAGMIDGLWALGRRLEVEEGLTSPFLELQPAHAYDSLEEARAAVRRVGEVLAREGVPEPLRPLVFGFAGYGNVSRGAQQILDLLGPVELTPEELLARDPTGPRVHKVVFREEHLVEPREGDFELQEYYDHPERYRGCFERFHSRLTVLVNCVYWNEQYPRLLTLDALRELFAGERPRLRLACDISCDVGGAVEATVKATEPESPVFVHDPASGEHRDGFEGPGLLVLAVDNLPAELPREASVSFSSALRPFLPGLARAKLDRPLEETGLPPELRRAVILHRGDLTSEYEFLSEHLPD